MTTIRSWAVSTSEPAMLLRRSEVHRVGRAYGLACWSGTFSRHLGPQSVQYTPPLVLTVAGEPEMIRGQDGGQSQRS